MSNTMSTSEAANRLGVSAVTVRKWLREGKLKGERVDPYSDRSDWRVYEWSVKDFQRKRRSHNNSI